MNLLQHMLLKLSEECLEVAHMASKCSQFGLYEVRDPSYEDNANRLKAELNDLHATIEVLNNEFGLGFSIDPLAIQAKKEKMKKFLVYSQELGMVDK